MGFVTRHFEHRALPFLEEDALARYGVGYPCATHLLATFERVPA